MRLAIATALALLAGAAIAQETQRPAIPSYVVMGALDEADADEDRIVTRAEFEAYMRPPSERALSKWRRLLAKHRLPEGTKSVDALQRAKAYDAMLDLADKDKNGVVTLNEIKEYSLSLFGRRGKDALELVMKDINGDGRVTKDERGRLMERAAMEAAGNAGGGTATLALFEKMELYSQDGLQAFWKAHGEPSGAIRVDDLPRSAFAPPPLP